MSWELREHGRVNPARVRLHHSDLRKRVLSTRAHRKNSFLLIHHASVHALVSCAVEPLELSSGIAWMLGLTHPVPKAKCWTSRQKRVH